MEPMHMISPLQDVYNIPVLRNAIYPETVPQDEIYPEPMFGPYQLIGDSLFLRFSEKILCKPSQIVNGYRAVGYCVSGQKIDQLRQRIKANSHPLADRIMALIGTNDVLCGGEPAVMIKHFKRLLRLLQKKSVKKLVVITLPPIPKLCASFHHWAVIRKYNEFLLSLKEEKSMDIEVVDVLPIFTKFKPALLFPITEAHLNSRRSNSLERNRSLERNSSLDRNSSLERNTSLERKNSLERGNILVRNNSLERSNSLERTSRLGWNNNFERRNCLEMPETPVSRESSLERKVTLKTTVKRITAAKTTEEMIKNEYLSFKVEPKEEKKKERTKLKVAREKIVDYSSSDSDPENESDASSPGESKVISNSGRAQEIMETPTIAKGIKRLIDSDADDDDDDDDIVAFNNALTKGSSKKRKIEYVTPESPTPTESKPVKKSPEPRVAQQNIFRLALQGIKDQTSPEKKTKNKTNIKTEPEKERNECLSANDSWIIDTDEDNLENCSYFSQEEEETNSGERIGVGNTDYREQFPEFIKATNELNFRKANSQTADQTVYYLTENDIDCTEYTVESETKDDLSEGEIEDDLSEGEKEEDSWDYDDKKGEAESESESEETSEDETQKRQLAPFIEYKFLKFLNSNCQYTGDDSSEINSNRLNGSNSYESPGYGNPNERFLSALNVPFPMEKSLFVRPSFGPYLYSLTPPTSAPPTPPPMPAESQATSYEGLTQRDKDIMEHSSRICVIECYEKFYTIGAKRIDMIHLNYAGLLRLHNFIQDNESVFF